MMTEEEAKTKWCPKAQVAVVESGAASNRESFALASQKGYDLCLGSACMAWRWQPQQWKFNAPHGGSYLDNKDTDGYGRKGESQPRVGFCGLAGKP